MKHKTFSPMIEKMLKQLDLPAELKADTVNNGQFHFLLGQILSDNGAFTFFAQAAGIEVKEAPKVLNINVPTGAKAVAVSPEHVAKLVVFIYQNLYPKMKKDMDDIEQKAKAESMGQVATGRA